MTRELEILGLDQYGATSNTAIGAVLLEQVAAYIKKYVVLTAVQRDTVTLWIVHAHAIRAFYTTGRLFLNSPEAGCGKSTLFDAMEPLVPIDPIIDVSISPAALYRSLDEQSPPVVLLDEIDNTIGRAGAADSESLSLLIAIINSGYRRGRTVRRCTGKNHDVVKFPTFCPVAFAGVTPKLQDTVRTRSIVIEMTKRRKDEELDEYVAWNAIPEGEALRDRLAAWCDARIDEFRVAKPERPPGIVNRLAESWVPLLQVAEVAGGTWPARARAAAIALAGVGHEPDDRMVGNRLLAAVRNVFGDRDAMWTMEILEELNADEEAPWLNWNDGAGITALDLAKRFKVYKLHRSADIKINEKVRKGYKRAWFEDAWARFLEDPAEESDGSETEASRSDAAGAREAAVDTFPARLLLPPRSQPLPRYEPRPEGDTGVAASSDGSASDPLQPAPVGRCSEVAATARTPGATGTEEDLEAAAELLIAELDARVLTDDELALAESDRFVAEWNDAAYAKAAATDDIGKHAIRTVCSNPNCRAARLTAAWALNDTCTVCNRGRRRRSPNKKGK